MSNLPEIFQQQLPAALRQLTREQILQQNSMAASGTGGQGVNKISLRGSRFRLVQGGKEVHIVPVPEMEVVVIRANEGLNKAYYAKQYQQGQEPEMPDCFSEDGVYPSVESKAKQCDTCAACPQNQWGSKINPTTGKKNKACSDSKRLAVVPPGDLDSDMYQLAIPAASLNDFGSFLRLLNASSIPVPFNALVTKVKFDVNANFPKIMFEPVRPLTDAEYAKVVERANSDEARRVCGSSRAGMPDAQPQAQAPQQAAPAQPAQAQPAQQQAQAQAQPAADAGAWGAPAQQAEPQQPPVQQAQAKPEPQPAAESAGAWGAPPQQQQAAPAQQAQQAAPAAESAGAWGAPPQQEKAPQQAAPAAEQAPIEGTATEVTGSDLDDVFGEGW